MALSRFTKVYVGRYVGTSQNWMLGQCWENKLLMLGNVGVKGKRRAVLYYIIYSFIVLHHGVFIKAGNRE
jgi:hypothetical protein